MCLEPLLRKILFAATLLFPSLYAEEMDLTMVPGSGSMPPVLIASPLPPIKQNFLSLRLGLWVNAEGQVTKIESIGSPLEEEHPALEYIMNWRFKPVLWEGNAIPFRAQLSLDSAGNMSMPPLPNFPGEIHSEDEFGLIAPKTKIDPDLQFPLELVSSRDSLEYALEYLIGEEGVPQEIKVLGASSASALNAGLNVLAGQLFEPGTISGTPVRVKYKYIMSVRSTSPIPPALEGLVEGSDPIYPYEELLEDLDGEATVKFKLNPDGSVAQLEIVSASRESFGLCLKACIESWLFSPEEAVRLPEREYTHSFSRYTLAGGTERLKKLLRKGEVVSNSAEKLSGRPVRVSSAGLVFPPDCIEAGADGQVVIEFVIDRCGLAQIPRIVKATNPSFGWAAANWIGSMRFKPLTRDGKPTDLRVSVPVDFKCPNPKPPEAAPAS